MASGLRAKLNRMRTDAPTASPKPRRGGVMKYESFVPLDPGLSSLSPVGLRRMGWTGGAFDVNKCLFIDTETTGLSGGAGTVAFLVGCGYIENDRFVIEQYLMREYADELEMIDALANLMDRFDSVCTFNGQRFDMPLIEARFTMCRMRDRFPELQNLDLILPARRAWKLRIGSCKLSNIEAEILNMPREHDLPGSEVPQRYFDFLKTGDVSLLSDIVEHNRQDIATLMTLLVKLCAINDDPKLLTDPRDQFSMGKSLERQGEWRHAREMYRVSAIPRPRGTISALACERVAGMANWRQYHILRRSGDVDGAIRILEQMLQRRQMCASACTALSKLYEHKKKDYPRALKYALKAGEYPDAGQADDIERRTARIRRKMNDKTEG